MCENACLNQTNRNAQPVQACDEIIVDNHERKQQNKYGCIVGGKKMNLWFLPLTIYSSPLIDLVLNHDQRIKQIRLFPNSSTFTQYNSDSH